MLFFALGRMLKAALFFRDCPVFKRNIPMSQEISSGRQNFPIFNMVATFLIRITAVMQFVSVQLRR
jgi:hypothetical protein